MEESKFSKLTLYWQFAIILILGWTAYEVPLSFSFKYLVSNFHIACDLIISTIFIVDILISKSLSAKQRNSESIGEQSFKYTKSHKFFDFIAVIPFDLIAGVTGFNNLGILQLLRLFKIKKIVQIFIHNEVYKKIIDKIKVFSFIILVIIVLHWISCLWLEFTFDAEKSHLSNYINSIYWVITTLSTVGFGDISPQTDHAKLFTMIIMILGVAFYGITIGFISSILLRHNKHQEESTERLHDLLLYMEHYKIPWETQNQVDVFYRHIMKNRMSVDDEKIINELPEHLQYELKIYKQMNLVSKVKIFADCNQSILKEVSKKLKVHTFEPGNLIIKEGVIGSSLYFVSFGVVSVYSKDKVISILGDGDFFGEIAIIKKVTRTANVKAITFCELYSLEKDDFVELVSKHPELKVSFENYCKSREKSLT